MRANLLFLACTLSLGACFQAGELSPKDDSGEVPAETLTFEPASFDFGDLAPGCDVTGELALRNDSSGVVELTGLALEGDDFALLTEAVLPAEIEPGTALVITVAYQPGDLGDHSATLGATTSGGGEATAALEGTASEPGSGGDSFTLDDPAVDLIFSADQSGSMDDDLASLARAFSSSIAALNELTTDWRIRVVNDDDGCSDSGVLEPTTADYDATFQATIRSGGGLYTEALYTVVTNALAETAAGGCDEGFLRDEALLHVITISDEPEQSALPWNVHVTTIQDTKPDPQQARISAVVDDCGPGASPTGYFEAVETTEGTLQSICDPWSDIV